MIGETQNENAGGDYETMRLSNHVTQDIYDLKHVVLLVPHPASPCDEVEAVSAMPLPHLTKLSPLSLRHPGWVNATEKGWVNAREKGWVNGPEKSGP